MPWARNCTGGGAGLAILMEDYASPAVMMLVEHIRKTMPEAVVGQYEPANGNGIIPPQTGGPE